MGRDYLSDEINQKLIPLYLNIFGQKNSEKFKVFFKYVGQAMPDK